MSKQKGKRNKEKFNMYQFTYKHKKAIVGTISLLIALSMLAGILGQYL